VVVGEHASPNSKLLLAKEKGGGKCQ